MTHRAIASQASASAGGCCGGAPAGGCSDATSAAPAASSCCGGSAAPAARGDATAGVMAALDTRLLGGAGAAVSRADLAAAMQAGPASASGRGPPGARASETFVDLEAVLREARAAGGDAFVFSDHEGEVLL